VVRYAIVVAICIAFIIVAPALAGSTTSWRPFTGTLRPIPIPTDPTAPTFLALTRDVAGHRSVPTARPTASPTALHRPPATIPPPRAVLFVVRASLSAVKAYALAKVGSAQFGCLDRLWMKESHWSVTDYNPSSGAYGIPQAVPGSKMRSAGADWRTNPYTQINWGLGYIRARYGSPCNAWAHSVRFNWY